MHVCLSFFHFFLVVDGKYLNYIEDFDLSHIGLVTIPNAAFIHFTALIRLNSANVSIQLIGDWFNTNNHLIDLDLRHNELLILACDQF